MAKNRVTLEQVKKQIKKLSSMAEWNEDEPAFQTAVILLSAGYVGLRAKSLAEFTGYPCAFISERVDSIKQSGLYYNGKLNGTNWMRYDDVELFMDVAIAEAMVEPLLHDKRHEQAKKAWEKRRVEPRDHKILQFPTTIGSLTLDTKEYRQGKRERIKKAA